MSAVNAKELLSRMTLREKAGQLCQRLYGFACYEKRGGEIVLRPEFQAEVERCGGLGLLYGLYRSDPWSGRDFSTGLAGVEKKRAYNLAQRYVIEHSRLGIPMLLSEECPHGHQALDGYLLPVNLALGASWNPPLAGRAFQVCGEQLRELGVDLALISMLDLLRDPRWGRSEECYGEDPVLASAMASAVVRGMRSAGVEAVAKHFCAQGETTGGVNASAARIGERELREIHLPAARAAVEAGAGGVMAAYNEIDGVFCHANSRLLRGILREELGFSGIVMADGVAIDRLDALTGSSARSAALALNAGVDVGLWDEAFAHLEEAAESGLIDEARLDEAVLRVLELKIQRGLFEHPYLEETEPRSFSVKRRPETLELALESPVLLKNNGVLPLAANRRIALIGPNGDSVYRQLGDYTPPQREGACVTLLSGLREELGEAAVSFCSGEEIPAAVELARQADAVILALGGSSSRFGGVEFASNGAVHAGGEALPMDCGEGVDVTGLRLPGGQEELARAVFAAGKPVVTVVIAGRPYAIEEIDRGSDALLYAFYPGPMGGRALARLLLGKASPSGRLPASLPKSAGHLPCYYNYKSSYEPGEPPWLYPFGFGLSYTRFAPERVRQEQKSLRFTLRNTGERTAAAVPQLFLRWQGGELVPRVRELFAFDKVMLAPGEARELSLPLPEGSCRLFLEEGGRLYWEGETA